MFLLAGAAGLFVVEDSSAQDPARERRARGRNDRVGSAPPAARAPRAAETVHHPLDDVIAFAQEGREALEKVDDYTAVFSKTEMVNGRMISQTMDMKFRRKPFSVYFNFRSANEEGRQVIYVAGANGNKLVVREAQGIKAIAGTMRLSPDDHRVMEENRYPITQVGIGNMLDKAFTIWEDEKRSDPANVDVKFFPNAKLGDVACKAVQITHTKQEKDLKFHLSRVYFDKETHLPVHAERYGWPRRPGDKAPLVEQYSYSKIRTNVGLRNDDFNPGRYGL